MDGSRPTQRPEVVISQERPALFDWISLALFVGGFALCLVVFASDQERGRISKHQAAARELCACPPPCEAFARSER